MVDPHAEIDFLTRSENRVTILGLLASGSHSKRELVDATEMSRATVDRSSTTS